MNIKDFSDSEILLLLAENTDSFLIDFPDSEIEFYPYVEIDTGELNKLVDDIREKKTRARECGEINM
ncbi:hypothetical protein LJC61_05280 [Ruminococcaceae bacterium OttesenSCG-928-A16]|nr:hypothetical protein [Ruminococcaceae bacterium OttesenSCG-928-A16]